MKKSFALRLKVERLSDKFAAGKILKSLRQRPFRHFDKKNEAAFHTALQTIEDRAAKAKMETLIHSVILDAQKANVEWEYSFNTMGTAMVSLLSNVLQRLRYTTELRKRALVNTMKICIDNWLGMKKRVTNENQSRKFDRVMKDIDDKKNERKERLLVNQNLGVNVRRTIAAETTDCILNLKKELLGPLVKAIGGKMTEDEFKEEYSKFF